MAKVEAPWKPSVYLGAATRSVIGKFGGALKSLKASELAAQCLKETVKRSGRSQFDGLILGHARQAGSGPNPARQSVFLAGLETQLPAITVNQACASGMTAVQMAAEKVIAGRGSHYLAGGVESMSNTPYLVPEARWGKKMGHVEFIDGMYRDGFFCPMSQMVMGETVERFIAQERGITRSDQDDYAFLSLTRAIETWKKSGFSKEVVSFEAQGKFTGLTTDEHLRMDSLRDSLNKLSPVFDPKSGTITAGNSSGITDGSASMLVSSERQSSSMVRLLDMSCVAIDPRYMGLAPVPAIQEILLRHRLGWDQIEAVEINEAFAAQVLACQRDLKIPMEKLNSRGGAIAIGHPIGASGARILVSLMHTLQGKPGALGIASACVSGGMGIACLVESLD
jgi:acetyl-CoA C-acetyltransferase